MFFGSPNSWISKAWKSLYQISAFLCDRNQVFSKEFVKVERTVTNSKFPWKCGYFGKPAETYFNYTWFFIWAFVSQNKTKHKQRKVSAEKEIQAQGML